MSVKAIFILTCTRQGHEPQAWYHTTLQEAQEHQRVAHQGHLMMHLANANRIKGALRTHTGVNEMLALAEDIVAENLQFKITKEILRGE